MMNLHLTTIHGIDTTPAMNRNECFLYQSRPTTGPVFQASGVTGNVAGKGHRHRGVETNGKDV